MAQADSAGDVRRSRRMPGAKLRPALYPARVAEGSAEPDTERASECGLAPAGVRARMPWAIPLCSAPRAGRLTGHHRRERGGQDRRQSRRRPVGNVIQSRGRPAESLVSWRMVTNHRVQCVDRAVSGESGRSGQRAPEQGSDYRVARVLGDRFHDGPGDSSGVEKVRITTAQVRQPAPGPVDVPVDKRSPDQFGLAGQGSRRCDRPGT
jgi:hypothetical protein